MKLPWRRAAAPTLFDRARDHALAFGAPPLIAEVFAEEVEQRDADGAYGVLGVFLTAAWLTWVPENLSACPKCAAPWAIFVPCVSKWECWSCDGPAWPAEPKAEAV